MATINKPKMSVSVIGEKMKPIIVSITRMTSTIVEKTVATPNAVFSTVLRLFTALASSLPPEPLPSF